MCHTFTSPNEGGSSLSQCVCVSLCLSLAGFCSMCLSVSLSVADFATFQQQLRHQVADVIQQLRAEMNEAISGRMDMMNSISAAH